MLKSVVTALTEITRAKLFAYDVKRFRAVLYTPQTGLDLRKISARFSQKMAYIQLEVVFEDYDCLIAQYESGLPEESGVHIYLVKSLDTTYLMVDIV